MRPDSLRSWPERLAIALLALWLPAGPLLSAAGACERAAAARCGHQQRRIGCHEAAKRPSCHENAAAQATATKEAKAAKSNPACCCAKVTIAASQCGCRHDGGVVAVTIENALPRPLFAVVHVLPIRRVADTEPSTHDVFANAPPVPPPRTLVTFHSS